jgi:hypothetical protein
MGMIAIICVCVCVCVSFGYVVMFCPFELDCSY